MSDDEFCGIHQGAAEVTLPAAIAHLICEYIDMLEHENHRLRNGYGRYGI